MEKLSDLFGLILNSGPSQDTLFLILTKMEEEGRHNEVMQECLKALKNYPDDIRLRNLLVKSYLQTGFAGLAEMEFNKITSGIDKLISTYKFMADLYIRQQRFKEAGEILKRYIAHYPDDREALAQLELVEHEEEEPAFEAKEAIEEIIPVALNKIEEKGMISEEATPTLAEIYFNQGQTEEALKTYEEIILRNFGDKTSRARLAELKALDAEKKKTPDFRQDNTNAKKEKMITILEGWLINIRELRHAR